jgi:copper chaperone CopZ
MQDFIIEGIGNISGGEFASLKVEGVGNCSNHIKAENIYIEGVFNCAGDVETGLLHCEGVADFKSNIRAKKIIVEGVLSEKDGDKIEAEEIICEGVIKTAGEISADILNAEGCIEAREIVGDQIRINSHYQMNRFMKIFNRKTSEVKLIEATTIELRGVTADTVNGRDITIGPYCNIDKIDCSGFLHIDKSSVVNTITGDYTVR